MSSVTHYNFGSVIEPAKCDCHQGQTILIVLEKHPTDPRLARPIGHKFYPNEVAAEIERDEFTIATAKDYLEFNGIPRDLLDKASVSITRDPVVDK